MSLETEVKVEANDHEEKKHSDYSVDEVKGDKNHERPNLLHTLCIDTKHDCDRQSNEECHHRNHHSSDHQYLSLRSIYNAFL